MPTVPPSQISCRIVKSMPYRGGTQVWSNRYFWNQTSLPSTADQDSLSATLVTNEKLIVTSRVTYSEVVWYAAGSDVPVRTTSLSGTGTMSESGTDKTPGDAAVVIRWSTTQRTSKNHPIYLFKYYHDARIADNGDPDVVVTVQHLNMNNLGGMLVDGITVGGTTYKLAGPHGAVAQGYLSLLKVTHRDFPR